MDATIMDATIMDTTIMDATIMDATVDGADDTGARPACPDDGRPVPPAHATLPTVTGLTVTTITNDAQLVITGLRFGEKPAPAAALVDYVDRVFTNSTVGTPYEGVDEGEAVPVTPVHPYSTNTFNNPDSVLLTLVDGRHSASRAHYTGTSPLYLQWPRVLGGDGGAPAEQRRLFASFWIRPSEPIPHEGHSSKFFRVWDDGGGLGTRVRRT